MSHIFFVSGDSKFLTLWSALWTLGITLQDRQLVVAAIPELPLPQCAAPQGSDEDGPQGYAGGEACLPLGWGREGAKGQPSTKIGTSPVSWWEKSPPL